MSVAYALAVAAALIGIWKLDTLRGTRAFDTPGFWPGMAAILLLQLVFDNATAAAGFWTFNPATHLGILVPVIPIENLAFGATLYWAAIFLYRHSYPSTPSRS